jgi:hypothetical protein
MRTGTNGGMPVAERGVDVDIGGFDRQRPSVRHGVARVDDQIGFVA